jgi:hypothetical protein
MLPTTTRFYEFHFIDLFKFYEQHTTKTRKFIYLFQAFQGSLCQFQEG